MSITTHMTGPGVTEVLEDGRQIGLITYNPGTTLTHYATYANADSTTAHESLEEALATLQLQHAVVRRLARSIRSIRPASGLNGVWDRGYNTALRDVERLLQEVVGRAPDGEGFTAITR